MMSLDEILSPKHRADYRHILEVRRVDGTVAVSAEDAADAILRILVTQHGKLDPAIATRLAELPHVEPGRADVVPAIVAGLAGDEPIVEAWIEAIAAGGFNLFEPTTYGSKDRARGSPGVFLQRMLANLRGAVNNPRVARERVQVQRTELAIMCAVMLVKQLQKAIAAKLALGPSYVVMTVVDGMSVADQRRIDALATNDAYRRDLRAAIAEVTARYAEHAIPERTNPEVKTSLPHGVDAEVYFSEREAARIETARVMLTDAVEQRCRPTGGTAMLDAILAKKADRVIAAVKQTIMPINFQQQIDDATAYLRVEVSVTPTELALHHNRLRAMMPTLSRPHTTSENIERLLCAAHAKFANGQRMDYHLFADRDINHLLAGIIDRIEKYSYFEGPPPPGVPIDHIPFFEQSAALAMFNCSEWPAKEAWQKAGLHLHGSYLSDVDYRIFYTIGRLGLNGFDIETFRKRHP